MTTGRTIATFDIPVVACHDRTSHIHNSENIMSEIQDRPVVRTLTDADGREIPVDRIRAQIVLEHEVVTEIVTLMEELAEHNRKAKETVFEKVNAYQELMHQDYGVRVGGRANGMTLNDFARRKSIKVDTRNYQYLTSSVSAAQALMTEIIDDLTDGASHDLRALVMRAFERDDKTGRMSVDRIIGLKQLELTHPKWPDAKRALEDSVAVANSKRAIVCRQREKADGAFEQIVVDFSRL